MCQLKTTLASMKGMDKKSPIETVEIASNYQGSPNTCCPCWWCTIFLTTNEVWRIHFKSPNSQLWWILRVKMPHPMVSPRRVSHNCDIIDLVLSKGKFPSKIYPILGYQRHQSTINSHSKFSMCNLSNLSSHYSLTLSHHHLRFPSIP